MPNQYINKVVQSNGTTLIDISDTTAVASDVASGKYFYLASGEKVIGTAMPNIWKNKNTCFFGDSIGAGYGNNNESFVDIIEDTGIFSSVHKNCVSGTTTSTLYGRMLESATELASADIVYCNYEGNDINGLMAGTLTTAQLETALRQAITYLRSINTTASVVWLPLTVYHFDKIGGANASYYKQWAEAMLPVFAELGINVIPIYDTLGAGHAQQDGRHPNATGHQIIAELVMQMPLGSSIYQPDILSEWTGGSY